MMTGRVRCLPDVTGRVRYLYQTRPVLISDVSSHVGKIPDTSDPHVGRVRSLRDPRIQLLFFTNFFSFANVLTPPSVHYHVYVC